MAHVAGGDGRAVRPESAVRRRVGRRLFWFDGEKPRPALEPALQAIARCNEVGLVPSDYDAAKLTQKWTAMKTAGAATSPADRALFDVAVTVSAARLLQAVHWGRVDPRLVGFNYDVTSERLDLAAELRSARDGAGLPAALDAAEPQFPVYVRMVKALGDYRALAAAEPPAVPALAAGTEEDRAGNTLVRRPGAGGETARLRRPARRRPRAEDRRRRNADLRGRSRRCGEELPAPPQSRGRRSHRTRHDPGPERAGVGARPPVRAGARARALASRDAPGAAALRQRRALPALGA